MRKRIPPIKRPIVFHFVGSHAELLDIYEKLDLEIPPNPQKDMLMSALIYHLRLGLLTGEDWGELPCRMMEHLSVVNSRIIKWQAAMEYMTERQRVFNLRITRISEPNHPSAAVLSRNEMEPW